MIFRSLLTAFDDPDRFDAQRRFLVDGGFAENLPARSLIDNAGDDGIVAVDFAPAPAPLNSAANARERQRQKRRLGRNVARAGLESLFRAQTSLLNHLSHIVGIMRIPAKFTVGPLDFAGAFRMFVGASEEELSELDAYIAFELNRICSLGYTPVAEPLRTVHQIDPLGQDYGWSDGLFARDAIAADKLRVRDGRILSWGLKAASVYQELAKQQKFQIVSRVVRVDLDLDKTRMLHLLTRTTFRPVAPLGSKSFVPGNGSLGFAKAEIAAPLSAIELAVAEDFGQGSRTRKCSVELRATTPGLVQGADALQPTIFLPSTLANPDAPTSDLPPPRAYVRGLIVYPESLSRSANADLVIISEQVLSVPPVKVGPDGRDFHYEVRVRNEFDPGQMDSPYIERLLLVLTKPLSSEPDRWSVNVNGADWKAPQGDLDSLLSFGTEVGRQVDRTRQEVFLYAHVLRCGEELAVGVTFSERPTRVAQPQTQPSFWGWLWSWWCR